MAKRRSAAVLLTDETRAAVLTVVQTQPGPVTSRDLGKLLPETARLGPADLASAIRGPLDANMPARVGLKMGKGLESRKLLSEPGAEKLLGHGDLLFKDVGQPRRLQAPLLSEENRRTIFQAGT